MNYSSGNNSAISAIQGTTLAGLIFQGGYHWNEQFDEQAVMNNGIYYQLGKECFVTVLKPDISDLERLGNKWKRDLKNRNIHLYFRKIRYLMTLLNTIAAACQQMQKEIMKR